MIDAEDITKRFTHHAPRGPTDAQAHARIRLQAKTFAEWINDVVPDGREKDLARARGLE